MQVAGQSSSGCRVAKINWREVRKYLYGVAIAALPIAILLGWFTPETAVLLVPLIVAILNLKPEDTHVPKALHKE